MGLCKCPRKKVTNLFCFQHKVNVCEHCLVASHPRCIVQSYLRWLRDSDISPVCTLCQVDLEDDDLGECVRLMCFDVFHWQCLDRLCRGLPPGGDLSQYRCPTCQHHVFPADNVVSPLAEELRTVLSRAGWARLGLGLPEGPVEETYDPSQEGLYDPTFDESEAAYDPSISYDEHYNISNGSHDWSTTNYTPANQSLEQQQHTLLGHQHKNDHVITLSASEVEAHMRPDPPPNYIKQTTPSNATPNRAATPIGVAAPIGAAASMNGLHKVHGGGGVDNYGYDGYSDQRSSNIGMRSIDSNFRVTGTRGHDMADHEDKYRRRTPALWTKMNSWPRFRRFIVTLSTYKLVILVLVLCLGGFILADMFITYGRTQADKEPFLDPMANPNIRVNSE